MTAVIQTRGLSKKYGGRRGKWALTDCTLSIPAGGAASQSRFRRPGHPCVHRAERRGPSAVRRAPEFWLGTRRSRTGGSSSLT